MSACERVSESAGRRAVHVSRLGFLKQFLFVLAATAVLDCCDTDVKSFQFHFSFGTERVEAFVLGELCSK